MNRLGIALIVMVLLAAGGVAVAGPVASQPATAPAPSEKDGLSILVKPVKAVFEPKEKLAFEFTFTNMTKDPFCIYNKLLDGSYSNDKELTAAADVTFTDTKTKQSWHVACESEIARKPKNTPTILLKPSIPLSLKIEFEDVLKFVPAAGGDSRGDLPPGTYELVILQHFDQYSAKMRYWSGEISSNPVLVEIGDKPAATSAPASQSAATQGTISKLIADLSSADGKARAAATKAIFAMGSDAIEPLKKAGAMQLTPRANGAGGGRIDIVYSLLEGLVQGRVEGYRTDCILLQVEKECTVEDLAKIGNRCGFSLRAHAGITGGYCAAFPQAGKDFAGVLKAILSDEPQVISVQLLNFVAHPVQ